MAPTIPHGAVICGRIVWKWIIPIIDRPGHGCALNSLVRAGFTTACFATFITLGSTSLVAEFLTDSETLIAEITQCPSKNNITALYECQSESLNSKKDTTDISQNELDTRYRIHL